MRRGVKYKYMKIRLYANPSKVIVKLGVSRQVVIPKRFHDQLGLRAGEYLEVELQSDRLVLTPKALIDKRLAEGLEDIVKGRVYGPFRSVKEMVRSLHKSPRKRAKL